MNFDSGTVADKLKVIRLGKENSVPFKYNDEEFVGRPLDWVEQMQIDSEVKSALHTEMIDFLNADHLMYRMMAMLNKGLFVPMEQRPIPDWLKKSQEKEGYDYLRGLYSSYMDAVYPKVEGNPEGKEPKSDDKKK